MNYCENNRELKNINSKILAEGENLPMVQLKDGTHVQTGTMAAMLQNIKRYNTGERGVVEQELTAAIPTLAKVGLFDLFPPEEWISSNNAGRRFIGDAARKHMEQEKKFVFPRFFMI